MTDVRGMMEGIGGPVDMDRYTTGGVDPTLDACCQREIISNRKQNAIERTLRRHDVVAMAERRRRNMVTTSAFTGCRCCYDPNSDGGEYQSLIELRRQTESNFKQESNENVASLEATTEKSDGDADSDDEFDYLLDDDLPQDEGFQEMEELRRAELEMEMLSREVALQHGYGSHRQLHPGRVLKASGLGDRTAREPPRAVVLHLVDPDSMGSASLDLYLEKLAAGPGARGTIFARSGGRSTLLMDADLAKKALPRLDPDRDMPALIAIRDGVAVNVAPRLQGVLNGNMVDERSVYEWLDKSGVIVSQPPPMDNLCYIRPEEEALMDYLATLKPKEEERFDCGMAECFKAYPHEHVGIQTSEQDGLVVPQSEILPNGDS